ncbi:hypothetical protein HY642_00015 [Candidatus Woesearchaeota archaeon]|nr:hypothetical protein [Candidatus Woesearchaeota archaeon]
MPENFVSEEQFASALVRYVQGNASAHLGKAAERGITDHWTVAAEGVMRACSCLFSHGLFDLVFRRDAIVPHGWPAFQRQYRTPEAELVERIYQECQTQRVEDWTPKHEARNAFHVTRDFWTEATQEENYRRILSGLRKRRFITDATRQYADDPRAIGLKVGNRIVDLPGSYRDFRFLHDSMRTEVLHHGDFPKGIAKYGSVVPAAFMVADTVPVDDERLQTGEGLPPGQKLFQLIAENTNPAPKHQSIVYALVEKTGDAIKPRTVGHMTAFMLEYAYGSPAGHILHELSYNVPQDDLADEELKSLRSSQDNWRTHHGRYLKMHPWVQLAQ